MGAATTTIEQLAHDVIETRDPEMALRALTALRQELESVEPALVQRALHAGASWSHIARTLGVSKQAAHRKYRHLAERTLDEADGDAKVLVAPEAKLSIQFAREEAKRLGQPAIGTEHILLGILRCEESHAVRALGALGVSYQTVSDCLCTTMPGLPPDEPRGERVSEQARRILDGSLREALKHGDGYVGVEHLLLALLADTRNGAVQTLESLHATPSKIRAELEREWPEMPAPPQAAPPQAGPPQAARPQAAG
jgi:ATP-dependent Clp protease ATP-binding subunit ClpA